MHSNELSLEYAQRLDEQDELASFRDAFIIADPDLIYVDGNSLGRLSYKAAERMRSLVEDEWGKSLIRGWNQGWYEAPSRAGDKIGKLVGATSGQVLVTDSTSVDLFKLTLAALSLRPGRDVVVSDNLNFPTDLYVLQGVLNLSGNRHTLLLVESRDDIHVEFPDLSVMIDQRTALVSLSHVTFKSGYLYDMAAVTGLAHERGALVLWDLSHSAGAVPIELDAWGVDFAIGCTYKYLNGGPGAPAFLYVRQELQDQVLSPIWGWFGQNSPFAFDLQYQPAQGVRRFLAGSPPMLSLSAMEAALDLPLQAGITRIRRKSQDLTAYCVDLVEQVLSPIGFTLGSPRDPNRRGSHVSIRHPDAYRINRALIEEMNVLPDFREPDNIRLGLAPLYTTFSDVWQAVDRTRRVIEEGRHLNYPHDRLAVT